MTGGPFALTGGFWVLPAAVQTPGAPTLTIVPAAPGWATISWTPAMPGYLLQSTDSLTPTNRVNSPLVNDAGSVPGHVANAFSPPFQTVSAV